MRVVFNKMLNTSKFGPTYKKENFGDVSYDRRKNEYENCEGVSNIIEEIRTNEKNNKECNNEDCWKASSLVVQQDCVPVYDWDGKFYKDRDSADAGLTGSDAEEIIRPSQGTGNAVSHITDKEPGTYVHKRGKFIMSSVYDTTSWTTASLDGAYGWLAKSDRRSNPGWLQMETEEGVELIKGVVTKGYNSNHYVKKFKVYVSRNGDSWKQMKKNNGSFDFTGSHGSEETHYFDHTVEAKYIRFYPDGQASGPWPALQAGYIRDKSGVVNCKLGDGILQGDPFFRFTFNEAKTREKDLGGKYSSGTAATTKKCPKNGDEWVIKKGEMPDFGPGGIPKGDIWVLRKNSAGKDYLEPIEDEMSKKMLHGCGTDPSHSGWYEKQTGGTPWKWSVCHKTENDGTEDEGNVAYSTNDGGYMFMYRRWDSTQNSNDAIYGSGKGYKKLASGFDDYVDNTYNGSASSNGSTYDQQVNDNTNFKNFDYNTVNIVRQPCNRGTTAVLPTLSTQWTSTIPACEGGGTGWKGDIWNYSGGTEGWLDQDEKLTWGNAFKQRAPALLANKGSGEVLPDKKVHEYLVEEKDGVTNSGDTATWPSTTHKGVANTKIGGNHSWHCADHNSNKWNTKLDNQKSRAEYEQTTEFIPVGIRIQPRNHNTEWNKEIPAKIKLDWISGSQIVTLGTFADKDTVKTILIHPNDRKATTKFHVYSRHGRNNKWNSFRINFLIGKIGGGYSQDKGSGTSSNPAGEPVACEDGWDGGVKHQTGNWGSYSTWGRCQYTSGSGTSSIYKKHRSRSRTNRAYRDRKLIVSPSNGGTNNCNIDTVWYPGQNTSDNDPDSANCTKSDQQLDGNHCCGGSTSQGMTTWNTNCCREGSSGCHEQVGCNSSGNARALCYTLMKNNNHNSCHWLHSDVGSGTYHVKSFAHNCENRNAQGGHCKANKWGGRIEFK